MHSGDYRKLGKEARELRLKHGHELDAEQYRDVEIQEKRSAVHAACESLIGKDIETVVDGAPVNVAGFYTPADRKISGIAETYDDRDLALHVADHEDGHHIHMQNGVTKTNFEGILSAEQINVLGKALGMSDVNGTNWMEGFNEIRTIKRRGRNSKIAYLLHEVPAAEKLETLCRDTLGRSLVLSFHSDGPQFYDRLRELCDRIAEAEQIETIQGELLPAAA